MNKHPNAGKKCERCERIFANDHAYPIYCKECTEELKARAAVLKAAKEAVELEKREVK